MVVQEGGRPADDAHDDAYDDEHGNESVRMVDCYLPQLRTLNCVGKGAFGDVFLAAHKSYLERHKQQILRRISHQQSACEEQSACACSSSDDGLSPSSASSLSVCSFDSNSESEQDIKINMDDDESSDREQVIGGEEEAKHRGEQQQRTRRRRPSEPKQQESSKPVAVKVIHKRRVIESNMIDQSVMELQIMRLVHTHPFIVTLKFAYQTPTKLYFGMEYCAGGELFMRISEDMVHKDDLPVYVAQIALALNFLHNHNIIYRDLKPENVALSNRGNVRLVDFGLSVMLEPIKHYNLQAGRLDVLTCCGTLAYSAPEILRRERHSYESDWWSLGIITHEMIYGHPPFGHEDQQEVLDQIVLAPYNFDGIADESTPAFDFCSKLLEKVPVDRLGYNLTDFEKIMSHPFLAHLNVKDVYDEKIVLKRPPKVENRFDVRNFDPEFTLKRNIVDYVSSDQDGESITFQDYPQIPEMIVPMYS